MRVSNARRPKRAGRHPLTHLSALLAASTLALAAPLHASELGESSAIDLSSYDGYWRRIDDGVSDEARLSAIDRAIAGLSWIMRKMASGVLRSTTTPPAEMQFVWDGATLHQGLQGQDGASSRPVLLDGQLRTGEDRRGVPFSWAWSWTDGALRVHWEQHQANGSNLYRIDGEDGRTLVVEHTIIVTAISNVEPIVYLSRFSRTDPPHESGPGTDLAAQRRAD